MAKDTEEARPATFDDLLNDGTPIRTVDLDGLLKTKRTVREKDKIDRLALERAIAGKNHD